VVAQRLIKRICKECITDVKVPPETLLEMGVPESQLHEFNNLKRGEGCDRCNGSGLSGRMAIFEVLFFSTAIKEAIFAGASTIEVKRRAVQADKMITLRGSALIKLKEGLTSVEEVLSGTVEDDL
jgi:type IV pilus assembly protein PilB